MLKVRVVQWATLEDFERRLPPQGTYVMDHDKKEERVTLGLRCREAFESGGVILTFPEPKSA